MRNINRPTHDFKEDKIADRVFCFVLLQNLTGQGPDEKVAAQLTVITAAIILLSTYSQKLKDVAF